MAVSASGNREVTSEFLEEGPWVGRGYPRGLLEGPGRDEGPAESGDRSCSGAWMFSLMGEHFLLSHIQTWKEREPLQAGAVFLRRLFQKGQHER